LLAAGTSEDALKQVEAETRATAQAAADYAQEAPEPDEAELWTNVLIEG
jgi:pyruvate dehydrogenase E1 component alpha subunit